MPPAAQRRRRRRAAAASRRARPRARFSERNRSHDSTQRTHVGATPRPYAAKRAPCQLESGPGAGRRCVCAVPRRPANLSPRSSFWRRCAAPASPAVLASQPSFSTRNVHHSTPLEVTLPPRLPAHHRRRTARFSMSTALCPLLNPLTASLRPREAAGWSSASRGYTCAHGAGGPRGSLSAPAPLSPVPASTGAAALVLRWHATAATVLSKALRNVLATTEPHAWAVPGRRRAVTSCFFKSS